MTGSSRKRCRLLLACLILVVGMTACAEVKINTLPSPPPTAKLRVFFLPVSDALPGRLHWAVSHKEYAVNMAKPLDRFLRTTGIYEIVPQGDVDAVLDGKQIEDIPWQRGNWDTARRVGRALHADYVVVARRGFQGFFCSRCSGSIWKRARSLKARTTLGHSCRERGAIRRSSGKSSIRHIARSLRRLKGTSWPRRSGRAGPWNGWGRLGHRP